MNQPNKKQFMDVVRQPSSSKPDPKKDLGQLLLGLKLSRYFTKKWTLFLVAIIITGSGGYVLYNNRNTNLNQIDIITDKVGKLMLLPSGEQPTMAVINDTTKFKDVEFFKNAVNGDRALVYAQARIAILYRPSINKIIAVVPLSPTSQPPETQK
jgi:hypothetical protein